MSRIPAIRIILHTRNGSEVFAQIRGVIPAIDSNTWLAQNAPNRWTTVVWRLVSSRPPVPSPDVEATTAV
jgi:hypothetical protein